MFSCEVLPIAPVTGLPLLNSVSIIPREEEAGGPARETKPRVLRGGSYDARRFSWARDCPIKIGNCRMEEEAGSLKSRLAREVEDGRKTLGR
jgi:hypothetical protein